MPIALNSNIGRSCNTIQGFIFSWAGHEQRAMALERKIAALLPVTVINSESAARRNEHWVHLDESAYFSEQWNRAMRMFDADLMFHVQADADSDHFADIVSKARSLFRRCPIGVYEPYVDYTDICYDRSQLGEIAPGVMQVPWTDCSCWFIHGDVVRLCPPFDLSVNVYGWGICRAIAAITSSMGLVCVRDYSYDVRHPKRRGYPSSAALQQLHAYVAGLPAELRAEIRRLERMRGVTGVRPE